MKLVAQNKTARYHYELLEYFEAGLALMGSEVKSLRDAKVSFKDGHVRFRNGEAFLVGVYIAPYVNAVHTGHDPERERKLLLHAREIRILSVQAEQKGLTVIPVRIYFKNGRAKVEIALARGKQLHDRRDDLKRRAVERDLQRDLSGR